MDFQSNPSLKEYTGEGIKKEQIERERERDHRPVLHWVEHYQQKLRQQHLLSELRH